MKLSNVLVSLLSITTVTNAAAIPESNALSIYSDLVETPEYNTLEKRKGGGGRSSSGSSSSSSSGSSSGSSGSSSSGGRTSGSSSLGSSSSIGRSGVAPTYGGGRYYGGGATSAYRSGSRSPRGVAPILLGGAALAVLPGIWLYGAYAYPYYNPYRFRNTSDPNATGNTTLPVECVCARYSDCGCDDNDDEEYIGGIVGNGSMKALNTSLAQYAQINNTKTLVLNGTLPNGTTVEETASAASSLSSGLIESSGFWVVGGLVTYMVWFI